MISIQDYCITNNINSISYNITKKSMMIDSKKTVSRTNKIDDPQIIKKIHNIIKK